MKNQYVVFPSKCFDADRYATTFKTAKNKARKLSRQYKMVFVVYEYKSMVYSSRFKVEPKKVVDSL